MHLLPKHLLECRRRECLGVEYPGHIYFSDFHSLQRTSGKPQTDGSDPTGEASLQCVLLVPGPAL